MMYVYEGHCYRLTSGNVKISCCKKCKKVYRPHKQNCTQFKKHVLVYISSFFRIFFFFNYKPKSEKVGTVWKTQIKKESSDF